ncbi:MAG: hypothetical protein KDD76_02540, partial [Rickettsiales bacterium]|nr:hypothetical protein [Rickettsiales bacterium]
MREFDYNVLNEIKQELRLIFEAHSLSYLKGKMRLFSVGHQRFFQAHEPGYEIWFGADEIDDTLNKLNALYRNGTPPNTPLILDPMLYRVQGQNISPVGSAIGWCTVLYPNADTIDETIINRIRDLRVFCSPFYSDEQQCSGLKIFAFLKEPILPNNAQFDQNGCMTNLTKALADLANVEDDAIFTNSYLLSGLNYRTVQGNYQHHSFKEVFGSIPVATPDQMRTQCIFPKHVQDAATCWNAYGRDVQLYERYGTNIDMLEANLQHKSESEKITDVIAKELRLIWRIQRSYGLNGEMRLFTAPHQKNWRSKEQGQEIWFGPEDDA